MGWGRKARGGGGGGTAAAYKCTELQCCAAPVSTTGKAARYPAWVVAPRMFNCSRVPVHAETYNADVQ